MNPKQESEKLMNAILPFAKTMLKQYGEFYPYGGYMRLDGTIVDVGAEDSETDRPQSRDLIHVLRSDFRELARNRQCKAAAVVFDVAVKVPNSDRKSDAIQICVDHEDGYSVEVFFPYQIVNNEVVYGSTFAQEGKREIFEKR